MKITKQKLKQIITEELKNVLNELNVDRTIGPVVTPNKPQKSKPAEDEARLPRYQQQQVDQARQDLNNNALSAEERRSKIIATKNNINRQVRAGTGTDKERARQATAQLDGMIAVANKEIEANKPAPAADGGFKTAPGASDNTYGIKDTGALSKKATEFDKDGDGVPDSIQRQDPTTSKTKKVRRKVRKGRHDVKFQRMINRMEKAGDLSKSDWSKISRINVKLKDPARAKELFNQITGKTQKKMKRDAAKLGLAGGIEDAGKNIRTDGSIDKKAIARTEQNAIELAQASDRPRLAKAIQRLQRRLKDAKKELKIQADAEREFGGGTVSPAATKAQLRVDYLEGRLSKIVQSTFERLKDAK